MIVLGASTPYHRNPIRTNIFLLHLAQFLYIIIDGGLKFKMDETPGYSKWRKPSAEPKPQEIAQKQEAKAKYEENEERRKLMMLENMRRRKYR